MISQELVKELFTYKDGVLIWVVNPSKGTKAGSVAGYLHHTGYRYVRIKYKDYKLHRVIFLYHHGYLPEFIDHADGDPLNNRIENLRECTISQNNYNNKLKINNTSGVKGVYWYKITKKWKAQISHKGKNRHVGYFEDIAGAEKAIRAVRVKLHGEFANHG